MYKNIPEQKKEPAMQTPFPIIKVGGFT